MPFYSRTPFLSLWQPNTVSLTFDDGPGPQTKELAEYLRDLGIPATFFILGENAETRLDDVAWLVRCGHSVGNHTFSHMGDTSPNVVADIRKNHELLKELLPSSNVLFRAPYGIWTDDAVLASLPQYCQANIGWHSWAMDWEVTQGKLSVEEAVEICFQSQKEHCPTSSVLQGVILLHDYCLKKEQKGAIGLKVVEITKRLVQQLRNKNVSFVSLQDRI